jgi:hypothetical protein
MRGYDRYNFDAFDKAQWTLEDAGHEVISPAQLDRDLGFDPDKTLEEQGFSVEEAMRRDVHAILKVDAIALLPGWEQSQGARTERTVAQALGLRIYEFDPEHPDALPVVSPDEQTRLNERTEAMLRHPSSQSGELGHTILAEARRQGAAVEQEAREAWKLNGPGITPEQLAHQRFLDDFRTSLRAKYDALQFHARNAAASRYVENEAGIPPLPGVVTIADPPAAEADLTNPKDLLGVKKPPLDLVPAAALLYMSRVMALGAAKYGAYNWREKAVRYSVYHAAAHRHLLAALDGETIDPESGVPHVAHAAACCAIILDAMATGNLVDDRPTPGAASQLIAELTES